MHATQLTIGCKHPKNVYCLIILTILYRSIRSFVTGLSAVSAFDFAICRRRLQLAKMLAELSHNIILGITALKFTILVGLLRIASAIPYIKERIQKYEEHYLLVPYQNFWDDYGSNEMLSCVLKIVLGDLNKTARLGNPAPNCKLVSTDGKECELLDFARDNRPLVVNFGSRS